MENLRTFDEFEGAQIVIEEIVPEFEKLGEELVLELELIDEDSEEEGYKEEEIKILDENYELCESFEDSEELLESIEFEGDILEEGVAGAARKAIGKAVGPPKRIVKAYKKGAPGRGGAPAGMQAVGVQAKREIKKLRKIAAVKITAARDASKKRMVALRDSFKKRITKTTVAADKKSLKDQLSAKIIAIKDKLMELIQRIRIAMEKAIAKIRSKAVTPAAAAV